MNNNYSVTVCGSCDGEDICQSCRDLFFFEKIESLIEKAKIGEKISTNVKYFISGELFVSFINYGESKSYTFQIQDIVCEDFNSFEDLHNIFRLKYLSNFKYGIHDYDLDSLHSSLDVKMITKL